MKSQDSQSPQAKAQVERLLQEKDDFRHYERHRTGAEQYSICIYNLQCPKKISNTLACHDSPQQIVELYTQSFLLVCCKVTQWRPSYSSVPCVGALHRHVKETDSAFQIRIGYCTRTHL